VSLASALALITVSLVWRRLATPFSDHRPQTADGTLRLKGSAVGGWLSFTPIYILVVGLMACKVFYLDTHETMFRRTRFDGTHIVDVARPVNANFDNQIALMGYEPESLSVEMGGTVRVALYWRAMRQLDADYSISAQIVDGRGFVYGQRDSQHPGGYPTSRWALNNYARDVHDIALAPGTPPGQYRLRVGVYRVGIPGGLDVLDANGAPAGTTVDVATVSVKRPDPLLWIRPKLAMPQPAYSSGATLAPGIRLLGYDLPQAETDAGAKLAFMLYWQAATAQTRDLKALLQLADLSGAAVYSADVAPISDQFPTSRLLAGDVLRGPNAVRIPASMPGGTFALRLRLVDESGAAQGDVVELGRVTVHVPERTMTPPHVESLRVAQVDLGGEVRLIGYDLNATKLAPGAALTVTVYWQAQREMVSDYKAFVHLLDAAGRLAVGSDTIPANWTRPTTGWIAGEYITDPHTLKLPANLPPGDYRLEVGLYEEDSGVRLGSSIFLDQPITVGQ
jgi:hypothetical protein